MKVDVKFTIQFMMKNKVSDIPRMMPLTSASAIIDIDVPDDIVPYVQTYVAAIDDNGAGVYNASPDFIKRWRKKVKEANPDFFRYKKPSDDEITEAAVSMSLDDAISEYLSDHFATVLETANLEIPSDNETEYFADKFIHVTQWDLA